MIRNVTINDAERISEIYNYYIENTIITFEEQAVSMQEMQERIVSICRDYPWIVFERFGSVLGYAYASKWGVRSSYRYSVESTVYVDREAHGGGIGSELYRELLTRLSERGYHAVLARLAIPNEASEALHKKLGFEKVAHLKEVGKKFGKWIDVGYWELVIGRRDE